MGLTCSLLPTHVPHRVKLLSGGPDYFSEILKLFFIIYDFDFVSLQYSHELKTRTFLREYSKSGNL